MAIIVLKLAVHETKAVSITTTCKMCERFSVGCVSFGTSCIYMHFSAIRQTFVLPVISAFHGEADVESSAVGHNAV